MTLARHVRPTRIAHVSDVHLDGTPTRGARFAQALDFASRFRPDHLVISGDLTANGDGRQYVELADAVAQWPSHRVTIVPGNHDGKSSDWQAALRGPLVRFTETSAPGAVVVRHDVAIVAVSTQIDEVYGLARGRVSDDQLRQLDAVSRDVPPHVAIAVVMHHGPQAHPLQPVDGLMNRSDVLNYLKREPRASVLCGHDHRVLDFALVDDEAVRPSPVQSRRARRVRIFTAGSVADHDDPVRIYDVTPAVEGMEDLDPPQLRIRYRSSDPGRYLMIDDLAARCG